MKLLLIFIVLIYGCTRYEYDGNCGGGYHKVVKYKITRKRFPNQQFSNGHNRPIPIEDSINKAKHNSKPLQRW